eukprot:CAMPEP_0113322604 /NCGR_PEP_ID=MMETSP0010_2-20120614/15723_1 /TAXON_ID=216773 ORGANISM="Corethron hystrix, Strain 308" /NCGR_SAMPLE_ID=MMETSP0010_2 /ASSEMBLY_ACC=CAM_ASM_000155 /LENGTH=100 /DNA_ID=CAMNT_0000181173 /DNA_START=130 /DNA_END=429 /DNA_ORIENTATION=- /assembly_acc=CAM_ASM_000155
MSCSHFGASAGSNAVPGSSRRGWLYNLNSTTITIDGTERSALHLHLLCDSDDDGVDGTSSVQNNSFSAYVAFRPYLYVILAEVHERPAVAAMLRQYQSVA